MEEKKCRIARALEELSDRRVWIPKWLPEAEP